MLQHSLTLMIVWIIVLVRTSPITTPSPQNGSSESTTSGSITTSTELGIAVVVRRRPAPKTTAPIENKPASSVTSTTELGIVNQTRQINDDGSYTFGYETVDGSFRIEKKDANGFVTGKYGYIDADGRRQEFDYVAGHSVGGLKSSKNTEATANSIISTGLKRDVVETTEPKADQSSQSTVISRATVPTYVPLSLRGERKYDPATNSDESQQISQDNRMYKIGQSIFRRPITVAPSTVQQNIEQATNVETRTVVVGNDPVIVQPTPTIGVTSTIEVVRQPQPVRQIMVEQPATEQQREIKIIQQADNFISVPATTTIIEQKPSVVLSRAEIPVIVETENPVRQLVVEQQQPPITQFVIDHQQPPQQIFLQRHQVIPQQNLITTFVQQPLLIEERIQPQEVFQIIRAPTNTYLQETTPVIQTFQSSRLDDFLRRFNFSRGVGNTFQIIGSNPATFY